MQMLFDDTQGQSNELTFLYFTSPEDEGVQQALFYVSTTMFDIKQQR
jgi:hypothetical protein